MQGFDDSAGVAVAGGGYGGEEEGDERRAVGFDGDGDEVEPGFVEGAGERAESGEIGQGEGFGGEERFEVPEADGGVGCHWGELEVVGYLEEGDGDRLGNSLE